MGFSVRSLVQLFINTNIRHRCPTGTAPQGRRSRWPSGQTGGPDVLQATILAGASGVESQLGSETSHGHRPQGRALWSGAEPRRRLRDPLAAVPSHASLACLLAVARQIPRLRLPGSHVTGRRGSATGPFAGAVTLAQHQSCVSADEHRTARADGTQVRGAGWDSSSTSPCACCILPFAFPEALRSTW